MTKKQFESLLIRLNPNSRMALEHLALPVVMNQTVYHCFITGNCNSSDASKLRYQCQQLEIHGVFDFDIDLKIEDTNNE